MKNLKKLFAVIVAVAMLATFAIPAFAAVPSDVEGTEYEDAVTRLVALGIITGRPDGTFAPEDTITRAEFAAVVVRTLGYDSAAAAAKGQTKFSDVQAGYWASGYINLANSLGIINGRPDGTFGPNDPVRYEEAVTMIVRALGYEPAAQVKGGYPTGYLVIAAEEDIDDGAEGVAGMFANRGLVAQLVDNSLEVPMMVQVGYGTEIKYVKSGTENTDEETLLDGKLKLEKYEAKVVSVGDELEVEYTNNDINGDKKNTKEKLDVFEALSTAGLEDAYVTIWVKDDIVYSISVDSSTYYDFIAKVDGEDDTTKIDNQALHGTEYEITLKNADVTFDVDNLSSSDVTEYLSEGTPITDDILNDFAKVVVKDGKVESIELYELSVGGIIEAVEDDYIKYTKGSTEGRKLRGMEDADSLLVVINGEVADYSDLDEDMVFDYQEFASDEFVIVATDEKAEGELSNFDFADGEAEVDDTNYSFDTANDYFSTNDGDDYEVIDEETDLDDLLGIDVVAYLTPAGDIRYVKGAADETTSDFYGYVMNTWSTDEDYVKVFREVDGAGEYVTYTVGDLDTGSVAFGSLNEQGANAVYKFTVNADGEITNIDARTFVTLAAGVADEFDEDNDAIEETDADPDVVYYVEDAIMFDISTADEPELVNWVDIENKEPSSTLAMKIENSKMAECVVFTAGFDTIADDDQYVAFVSDKTKHDADYYELTLETATDTLEYLIDETDPELPSANEFVVYVEKSDDTIDAVQNYAFDWTPVDGTAQNDTTGVLAVDTSVYSIDGDFIKFNDTDNWTKVDDNVIVYEVSGTSSSPTFEVSDLTSIVDEVEAGTGSGDEVQYYVKDGVVKAIFFKQ